MKQVQNTENNITFVFTSFEGQKDSIKMDNRKFWKIIRPLFENKIKINQDGQSIY